MSDESAVQAEIDALTEDAVIGDGCARTIAAQWHSPADRALTALSTTGAISAAEVVAEIALAVTTTTDVADLTALHELARYAERHGDRGRVDGWASVWVR